MGKFKKFIAATVLLGTLSGSIGSDIEAQQCVTEAGGWGYENSCNTPSLTTYIALGTVVVVAIVALAVRHHGHHHAHAHTH